ncbi:Beta-hexosaminidase subunit beta [Trichoplax sp. H2]|nr:Beta-hexosaminidase subunit beta [Trichoplax sp. H2]|eukprot:RDD43559.1 Beta-hexosaminidase subunit beta [Trichoplax sp. H2]
MASIQIIILITLLCQRWCDAGSVWPMPQIMSTSESMLKITQEFQFETDVPTDILNQAFQRYRKLIFLGPLPRHEPGAAVNPNRDAIKAVGNLTKLFVQIDDVSANLTLNSDESYSLSIHAHPQPVAFLHAKQTWGALRGLESFSQLIDATYDGFFIQETKIVDYPRFKYRGVMLDSARHYLTLDVILQNLDAMSYNKFNVFHWHIVDDQSFPFVSLTYPQLSQHGSYTPRHVYTPDDVQMVIEYARDRGIRVIVEFDTPGHSSSWRSIPNFLTPCYSKNGVPNGQFGPINPILNSTYTILEDFFREIKKRFPDQYVHLGGDEVNFSCWQSNPDIQNFMTQHGFGDHYELLEQYYEHNLVTIMEKIGLRYIIWQDVVDNNVKVDPNTVVQVWKTSPSYKAELAKVTKMNLQTILSSCWYLNYIGYGRDWERFYRCDPQDFKGTQQQKNLVIGGEACIWGEYVDSTNLMERFWPRASAVSERLWSSAKVTNVDAALPRIDHHRCYQLIRRGLRAQPINGYSFCQAEYNVVMNHLDRDEL